MATETLDFMEDAFVDELVRLRRQGDDYAFGLLVRDHGAKFGGREPVLVELAEARAKDAPTVDDQPRDETPMGLQMPETVKAHDDLIGLRPRPADLETKAAVAAREPERSHVGERRTKPLDPDEKPAKPDTKTVPKPEGAKGMNSASERAVRVNASGKTPEPKKDKER